METKISIKQISHPDNPNLTAKYVGAKEYAVAKSGKDGKIITGVDENAYFLSTLDDKERKKKSDEIKKERESLEKLLNVTLTPDSDFWNKFVVILEDETNLDPQNPLDRLREKFLIANAYVAPSKEAIEEDERYFNCVFYIYRQKEEMTKSAQYQKKKDKAVSILFNLQESEPNKLQHVGADIFGYNVDEVSPEESYVKLKELLDVSDPKQLNINIKRFLDSANKTPEQMMIKKILDKAIKKRFVTAKGGIYRRGDAIYGNNYEEALEFLESIENSGELASLKKEVDRN